MGYQTKLNGYLRGYKVNKEGVSRVNRTVKGLRDKLCGHHPVLTCSAVAIVIIASIFIPVKIANANYSKVWQQWVDANVNGFAQSHVGNLSLVTTKDGVKRLCFEIVYDAPGTDCFTSIPYAESQIDEYQDILRDQDVSKDMISNVKPMEKEILERTHAGILNECDPGLVDETFGTIVKEYKKDAGYKVR